MVKHLTSNFFVTVYMVNYLSFSTIHHFLPNHGRILPVLIEKGKIKTHNLQIISLTLCQLCQVTIWLPVSIIKAFIKLCSICSRNEQSPTCEVVHETKLTSEISFSTDSLPAHLVEHETDDLKVVGSIPSRGNFFILLLLAGSCHDLSGNDEMTNYRKTRISKVFVTSA